MNATLLAILVTLTSARDSCAASLAMHNVPEGLAVALVLMPRGITGLRSILWAIFTSMPQVWLLTRLPSCPCLCTLALVKVGSLFSPVAPLLMQPLIAVPVFMFARHFIFWRSVGLGFAAGSMIWVTCFELLADAIKVGPHSISRVLLGMIWRTDLVLCMIWRT